MKVITLSAATGPLAAMTAPATAADFAPVIGYSAPVTHDLCVAYRDPPSHARAYGRRDRDYRDDRRYDRDDRHDGRRYDRRVYDDRGRY